jgi:hypothetical protein
MFIASIWAEQKSARNAMLMSAIIPGAGQFYIGSDTKGGIFLGSDIVIIGSYIRFRKEKENAVDHYKMFANAHAGLQSGRSEDIYILAQQYMSSELHNLEVEMQARNFYIGLHNRPDLYQEYLDRYLVSAEDSWEWLNTGDFKRYYGIRRSRRDFEVYETFALGAMILNRVISSLDAAISTNRTNRNTQLYSLPDFDRKGLTLIYEYRF